jgi:hypothetical protein
MGPRNFKSSNSTFITDIESHHIFRYTEDDKEYFVLTDEDDTVMVWAKISNPTDTPIIIDDLVNESAIYGTTTMFLIGLLYANLTFGLLPQDGNLSELWLQQHIPFVGQKTSIEYPNIVFLYDNNIPRDSIKKQNEISQKKSHLLKPYLTFFHSPRYL